MENLSFGVDRILRKSEVIRKFIFIGAYVLLVFCNISRQSPVGWVRISFPLKNKLCRYLKIDLYRRSPGLVVKGGDS